jgi:signal transduction histidine kinase
MKNKRKPDITEDLRKELTMVRNSASLLLALINDLIYVSKEETRLHSWTRRIK